MKNNPVVFLFFEIKMLKWQNSAPFCGIIHKNVVYWSRN
jgi:hypothetical protein